MFLDHSSSKPQNWDWDPDLPTPRRPTLFPPHCAGQQIPPPALHLCICTWGAFPAITTRPAPSVLPFPTRGAPRLRRLLRCHTSFSVLPWPPGPPEQPSTALVTLDSYCLLTDPVSTGSNCSILPRHHPGRSPGTAGGWEVNVSSIK